MADLPERADLDQLRRKARELLRAAIAGEPEALARLHAVSGRLTLAAAQLAIAREHGLRSWPALRSEVESRRQPTGWQLRADAGRPQAQDIAQGRWSFGGAGTIEVEEGELTLGILVAGPEGASLEASLAVAEAVASARVSRGAGLLSCATSPSPMIRARRSPCALSRGTRTRPSGAGSRSLARLTRFRTTAAAGWTCRDGILP